MNARFYGMLGLAMRAGRLVLGESKAADAVRSGKAEMLILAADASANTEKKFLNMTKHYGIQTLRPGDRARLGAAVGKAAAVVIAVTEPGFARQLSLLSQTDEV